MGEEITSDTQKCARIISKVLNVDVEIVDNNLVRIAGTGRFSGKMNNFVRWNGNVYREIIRTGEPIISEEGEDKQYNFDEHSDIALPLKKQNEVIGVMGLALSKEQRQSIMGHMDIFLKFLDQMSELIAFKVQEENISQNLISFVEIMTNIMDKIDQGVIVLDEEGKIKNINNIAKKMLDIDGIEAGTVHINPTGNIIVDQDEYILKVLGKTFTLIGDYYKVTWWDYTDNQIFIFTEIDALRNKMATVVSVKESMQLERIIGGSKALTILKERVKKVAASSSTVLITGESGTGKELFARAMHSESSREDGPFIGINCAAIPETLLESELFGYVRGAFTGADPKGKVGTIELANKGTLFLDEIGDMSLHLQAKLLRVLEDREVVRLGSNVRTKVDVRIVAASNKDLEKLIKEKTFRDDLYYRLNVIPFAISPLRQRREDIRILTENFAGKYAALFDKKVIGFENTVWEYLEKYNWPGNVRELENAIEYAVNMMDNKGIVTPKHLLPKIVEYAETNEGIMPLEEMERDLIERALLMYGNSVAAKQKVAEVLGIGIATLYRKMKKYGL